MPRPQSHLLRRGRCSEPGRLYLLTAITYRRNPLFLDWRNARQVVRQLRRLEQEGACLSLAWVVMPDHVHWLVELRAVTLATLMRRAKARSSLALHKAGVRSGQIWQSGYQDRALRKDEDVRRVARYIVANPIRAGLAESVRLYPHWDAIWL